MKRIVVGLAALTLLLPATGRARTEHRPGMEALCGTRVTTTAVSLARHEFNRKRLQLERPDRLAVGQPGVQQAFTVTKQKNIAVIEDDGTLVPPPNIFDLTNQGVQFKRSGPGTRAEPYFGGVKNARGDVIQMDDDDTLEIELPFPFTFYGKTYDKVYLYSDGNLTFVLEDPAIISFPRDLNRFVEGPPRIAVDFLDLDPSSATGGGTMYLLVESGRVRVTWEDVPQYDLTDSNTFQVTLFPNGRITMAYEGVAANTGIVGVSPGGPGTVTLIDLSRQLPINRKLDAIAEEFREDEQIDDLAVARAVLSAVKDEYDMIVLFADFPVELPGGAFAYNAPIKNDIAGIGDDVGYDASAAYGSKGRLEAFVQMGSLANYPGNPNNFIRFSEAPGIGVLAHEVGHRWLAFVQFMRQGRRSNDLLGRQLGHWSFLMDSDASVMEGNDIRDDGNGRFETVATWQGYSALDLYLMGFNRAGEVPPFFYVAGSQLDPATAPSTGVIITGTRRDVTVDQIIAAEGPRVPGFAGAQKKIQVAFALLGREGEPPSLDSIKKVNRYRNRLSTYFRQQTRERGRIATWLRLRRTQATARGDSQAPSTAAVAAEGPAAADTPPAATARELRQRLEHLEPRRER